MAGPERVLTGETQSEGVGTLPITAGDGDLDPTVATLLIRIGRSYRPLDPGACIIDLGPLSELSLGRGEQQRQRQGGDGTLRLELDDPWMSTRHARLTRYRAMDDEWFVLEDLQSTNGCRVNGHKITRHQLVHGDMVETGQTFWRFFRAPLQEREALLGAAHDGGEIGALSTVSPKMLAEIQRLGSVAGTAISMLIVGQSGTGKEVMAAEIHRMSGRPGRFVALNCAAIPEGLIESELFGHRKGAFTGATADKKGVVEAADRGSLLLDEVGDMPAAAQPKVLRLLQDASFIRVGETSVRRADLRFLAATNQDLEQMVQAGGFRGDLFARLNGYTVTLPPLSQRIEDLGLLLAVLLERSAGPDAARLQLSRDAFGALLFYHWPYNIRELQKVVDSAVALCGSGQRINRAHLPAAVQQALPAGEGQDAEGTDAPEGEGEGESRLKLDQDEARARITGALRTHGGNVAASARALGTSRVQLYRWLKRLDLDPTEFRRK